jgi:predicted Zn finger-like uncharacterized protein
MTQMVTRCPKCATAFRITSTQLESAKGAVRCGSCLHIFKAQDFLVKSATPEAAAQTTKPTATSTVKVEAPKIEAPTIESPRPEAVKPAPVIAPKIEKPEAIKPTQDPKPIAHTAPEPEKVASSKLAIDKAKALEDEDDVLISDDMDKVDEKASTYEFDGFMDVDLQPKQTVSLFEREIRYDELKDGDDEENADESWAEDLLDDDEETLHQLKKTPPPVEPIATIESEPETPAAETTTTKTTKESESGYSGPIFSLISETTDESETKDEYGEHKEHQDEHGFSDAFLTATRAPESAPATTESSEFAASLFEAESDSDEQEEKAPSKRPVKSPKMRAFDTSRAALLMNIMPAPVEFTAKRMRRWYQQKLWPTLSILMATLLFFQIAYFKFDYFSRVEPTRTAYLFMCPLFGCDVPPLVDIMEIETTNLIVRNHPKVGEALLVDAILINKAPFEQPFPDLILSFSKLDETPVASRRFTPKEYLGGELAGMKYIPERQPVHIALEIADPGPEAVNYTLSAH